MSEQKEKKFRGISRIDYKSTHGWFARVYMKNRHAKSKLFSDKKLGGREIALQKARKWIQEQVIPEELQAKRQRYFENPPKNNSTGRVGVSKTFSRTRGGKGEKIWCFSVSWNPIPGHPKSKSFYINQYASEQEAFKAACDFRAEMEREIDRQIFLDTHKKQMVEKQS